MTENMERARALINELVQTNMERFLQHGGFLSPQWWLLLVFLIGPWVVWIRLAEKTSRLEAVTVGLIVALESKLLDLVGYNLNFWDYPIQILPLVPEAFAFDLSMVPVAYMLLYRYLKSWISYGIGLLCMSLIYAFIGEPLCNWLMLVVYIKWKYIYSFVYYIVTGIAVRTIVEHLKGKAD